MPTVSFAAVDGLTLDVDIGICGGNYSVDEFTFNSEKKEHEVTVPHECKLWNSATTQETEDGYIDDTERDVDGQMDVTASWTCDGCTVNYQLGTLEQKTEQSPAYLRIGTDDTQTDLLFTVSDANGETAKYKVKFSRAGR